MITYDNIPIHGSITIEEHKSPRHCDETCSNFEQTDSLTPIAGRCSQIEKGGAKAVVFTGDLCLVDTMKQDAA